MSADDKRAVVQSLVSRIEVGKTITPGRNTFDSDRVNITFRSAAIWLYFSRSVNRRSRGQETPQDDGAGRHIAPQWPHWLDDLWPYCGFNSYFHT
jgi:hypothetical protein